MSLKQILSLSLAVASGAQAGAVSSPEIDTRAVLPGVSGCPSVFAIQATGADNQTYYVRVNSQFRGLEGKPLAVGTDFQQSFNFFLKGTEAHMKSNPELYINRDKCSGFDSLSYQANADKLEGENGSCLSTVTVVVEPLRKCGITLFDGLNKYPYIDDYGYIYLASKPLKQNATVIPLTNLRAVTPKEGKFPAEPAAPLPTGLCPSVFEIEFKGENSQTYYARGADGAPYSLITTPFQTAGISVYVNGTKLVYNDYRSYYLHTTTESPGFQNYLVFVSDAEKVDGSVQQYIPIVASVNPKDCSLSLKWDTYSTVYLKPQARRSSIRILSIPGPQGPLGDNVKMVGAKAVRPAVL